MYVAPHNYPFGGKPPKAREPLSVWRETSQSLATLIVDRPTNNQRSTIEDLKYNRYKARWRQHTTNNKFELWQNLALFGGRPIGSAVEALLTKVVNQ
jgi:hypothetical protein